MFKRLFENLIVWAIKLIVSFIGVIILFTIYSNYISALVFG